MYLLYCDETNFAKTPDRFFVYGGVVIDAADAGALSAEIEQIRKSLRVPCDYLLKFNPGPASLSHTKFIELKQAMIAAAVKFNCKLLVNLLLHDIATSSEEARRNGINTLCFHFDCFLNRPKDFGLVLIDRFCDKQIDGHLKKTFAVGLTGMPYSATMKIERIVGYHYTTIGQSHFCSLVDVLLGSLRYAINAFTPPQESLLRTARELLSQMAPLFFRESDDKVHEISLCFSPKKIRRNSYRSKYLALQKHLTENGIVSAQTL